MSSPMPLRDYTPMSGDAALPPPPPASWADYFWWILLGLLGLIALGIIAAVVLAGVYGSKTLHRLDTWPSPSSAATAMPSPTAAATIPPTPTSAATRYPSFSSFPTPSPVCACCAQCNSAEAYECACCQYCPSCEGQVSSALDVATLNVVGRVEAGNAIPSDTTLAVGNDDDGGRIITVVNREVVILNKATHARISGTPNFYGVGAPGGDPWVSWDPLSSRFFLTAFQLTLCANLLNVTSPASIAGIRCAGRAQFGPATYALGGSVELGSPLNGCGPMASLTGKIALIARGTCGFAIKVKNAQNAGAIGVIVYNNVGDSLTTMTGVDPSIVIPSIYIGLTDGTTIGANLPATVSITSDGVVTFSTTIFISASTTSAPNDRTDFNHYTITDSFYADYAADYPKHTVDNDALYISTQLFDSEIAGNLQCVGPNLRAFDKATLLDGTGPDTLWDTLLPGGGIDGPLFVAPQRFQPPVTDTQLPMLFVGLDTNNYLGTCDPFMPPTPVTGFIVYGATAQDGVLPYAGFIPFPTPMQFGACFDPACNTYGPLLRQPPPAIPALIESPTGVISVGTVFRNKMYFTVEHNVTAVQTVTRWFVVDVAPMALQAQPVLLDWGDLNVSPDIDTSFSRIDVNDDETFAIVFYTSGPDQHITASYTFHAAADAPHTVRMPFRTAVPNDYVYFEDFNSGRNRYGDYTGLQVDPVDRATFYGYTQRPDPLGLFLPPGQFGPCLNTSECVARYWTTDLFAFGIDLDTCPTDGVVTTPTVLPPAAPAVHTPSTTAAAVDPAEFEIPLTNGCQYMGAKTGYWCVE